MFTKQPVLLNTEMDWERHPLPLSEDHAAKTDSVRVYIAAAAWQMAASYILMQVITNTTCHHASTTVSVIYRISTHIKFRYLLTNDAIGER